MSDIPTPLTDVLREYIRTGYTGVDIDLVLIEMGTLERKTISQATRIRQLETEHDQNVIKILGLKDKVRELKEANRQLREALEKIKTAKAGDGDFRGAFLQVRSWATEALATPATSEGVSLWRPISEAPRNKTVDLWTKGYSGDGRLGWIEHSRHWCPDRRKWRAMGSEDMDEEMFTHFKFSVEPPRTSGEGEG